MKKIVFITQYYPPDISPAGLRIQSFVNSLKNENVQIYVITSSPHYRKVINEYKLIEIEEKILIFRLKLMESKNNFRKIINEIIFMIKSFLYALRFNKIDLLIVSIPPIFTGLSGLILSKFKKAKFIVDVRDLWVDLVLELKQIKINLIKNILIKLEKLILNNADCIICTTNGFKDKINKKLYKKIEITTIMNGIDSFEFNTDLNGVEIREKFGFNKDDFIITYIGNIGEPQGLITLLDCFIKMNKIKFLLIGNGGEKKSIIKEKLRKKIDNLVLLPTINREKLKYFYKISNALLVHLRKSEILNLTIPSKIFEYLINEIPILYGLDGEGKKILENLPGCIYFEQENCESLSNSIEYLLNKYEEIKKSCYKRKELIYKNFSREKLAIKFKDLILFQLSNSQNNLKNLSK